jgi:hypothetical protein
MTATSEKAREQFRRILDLWWREGCFPAAELSKLQLRFPASSTSRPGSSTLAKQSSIQSECGDPESPAPPAAMLHIEKSAVPALQAGGPAAPPGESATLNTTYRGETANGTRGGKQGEEGDREGGNTAPTLPPGFTGTGIDLPPGFQPGALGKRKEAPI